MELQTWELWYPGAGATGIPFARGRIDPTDVLWVHSAPGKLAVTVRQGDERVVARADALRRRGDYIPMTRLSLDGDAVRREDRWPTDADVGSAGDPSRRRGRDAARLVERRRFQRVALERRVLQPQGLIAGLSSRTRSRSRPHSSRRIRASSSPPPCVQPRVAREVVVVVRRARSVAGFAGASRRQDAEDARPAQGQQRDATALPRFTTEVVLVNRRKDLDGRGHARHRSGDIDVCQY